MTEGSLTVTMMLLPGAPLSLSAHSLYPGSLVGCWQYVFFHLWRFQVTHCCSRCNKIHVLCSHICCLLASMFFVNIQDATNEGFSFQNPYNALNQKNVLSLYIHCIYWIEAGCFCSCTQRGSLYRGVRRLSNTSFVPPTYPNIGHHVSKGSIVC